MKNFIAFFFVILLAFQCSRAQNILMYCNDASCDQYESALTSLGYTYTRLDNQPLDNTHFAGIDIFMDMVISNGADCGVDYTNSIPAIQTFMDAGSSLFMQIEDATYNACNQIKLDANLNPYVDSNVVAGATSTGSCRIANALPADTGCVETVPNDISGNTLTCSGTNDLSSSLDFEASLQFTGGAKTAGIWGESDVIVAGTRVILWSDVDNDFANADQNIFHNMVEYLANGCPCDTSTECDGISCGIGLCGGTCDSCDPFFEMCNLNTRNCECNTANECVNAQCGTGFCGGACTDTCGTVNFSCATNICNDTGDGNGVCVFTTPCPDDGDACTVNTCQFGACSVRDACPPINACQFHECTDVGGVPQCDIDFVICDDANECTLDFCDPILGCQVSEILCDDSDACTTESCDPSVGCVYEDIVCDDGNLCTNDYCDKERGCQITWVFCDDNNPCTIDSCDEATGLCVNTEKVCDDGNPETVDFCDEFGECQVTDI